jgi:hypothetical protein
MLNRSMTAKRVNHSESEATVSTSLRQQDALMPLGGSRLHSYRGLLACALPSAFSLDA